MMNPNPDANWTEPPPLPPEPQHEEGEAVAVEASHDHAIQVHYYEDQPQAVVVATAPPPAYAPPQPHQQQQQQQPQDPGPQAPLSIADHKVRISDAIKIPHSYDRDDALIAALRGVSAELEDAEEDAARAKKRAESARELFDWAAGALSGYAKAKEPKCRESHSRKRGRRRTGESNPGAEIDYEEKFRPPAEGPLVPPLAVGSGGGMTEEQVAMHREAFYERLCGVPYAQLGSYVPPPHLVNLKSRVQVEEYIHIVMHWDTGTETMDVMDFRRQHKGFYTKMKMSKENIGRRTGHHLRDLAGSEGKKAFCRYGKSDESLMYITVEELYDAIFEIHCLTGHRGWQASKKIANLRYANIPQDQLKAFIETCPICSATKGLSLKRMKSTANEEQAYDMHNPATGV